MSKKVEFNRQIPKFLQGLVLPNKKKEDQEDGGRDDDNDIKPVIVEEAKRSNNVISEEKVVGQASNSNVLERTKIDPKPQEETKNEDIVREKAKKRIAESIPAKANKKLLSFDIDNDDDQK